MSFKSIGLEKNWESIASIRRGLSQFFKVKPSYFYTKNIIYGVLLHKSQKASQKCMMSERNSPMISKLKWKGQLKCAYIYRSSPVTGNLFVCCYTNSSLWNMLFLRIFSFSSFFHLSFTKKEYKKESLGLSFS